MVKPSLSLILAAVVMMGAGPPEDASQRDLDAMQGAWTLVKSVREGEDLPKARIQGNVHTVRKDRWIPGRDADDLGTITLDAMAKPRSIDLKDREGKVMLGIYRFDDDETLTVCLAREGVARPDDFVSAKDSKRYLIVLKRRTK
ncbi:TIGR03067 domain-containing protein [Singulisphaera sp. PoT]|uniref:TIGR03067 domain-containing protein n=1 Tax=Singulisphaera sp. PoT TaxID=3411797 RepID=UPI003BF60CC9